MGIKLLIFLIIFIILIFVKLAESQLSQIEYNCLVSLATKTNTLTDVPKNSTDGIYDFCASGHLFLVTCPSPISFIRIMPTGPQVLYGSDFQCLSNVNTIELHNAILEPSFLSSPLLPSTLNSLRIFLNNSFTGFSFSGELPSNLTNFYLDVYQQITNTTIPFSWISSSKLYTSHLIYFVNDLEYENQIVQLSQLYVISMNFPSFKNIKSDSISISLNPGYDKNSLLNNIITIGNLKKLKIVSSDITFFPTKINQTNSLPNSINFDMPFYQPTSIIDLSNISVNSLHFKSVGRSFSFNNGYPFILPKSIKEFSYNDGFINTLDLTMFKNLNYLSLPNNSMTGVLPPVWDAKTSNITSLSLSYNKITGTIDRSYCQIELSVSNNSLTGELPSCITCFLVFTSISDGFSGNKFTNFDNPPPCTTIVPNAGSWINKDNITYELDIFGQDIGVLGFDVINGLITFQPKSLKCVFNWPGLFNCRYNSSNIIDPPPRTIKLSYSFPIHKSFTISPDPLIPQLETVNWNDSKNNTNLIFNGSFFSYNITIINIKVGNVNCIVSGSTFNQINCTLALNPFSGGVTDIVSYVTVGSLKTQLTLTPGILNTVINCSTPTLNDCYGNGYCKTSNGVCVCNNLNFNDTACSICDSSHQGKDCILPFASCPSYNSITCNGQSCNNQTGLCNCPNFIDNLCSACDSTHQGKDCSLPFIQCPYYNSLLCNGNGNLCNNQTGECQCLPNQWSGNDCSVQYHYISSVIPSTINGGNASFIGDFGYSHSNLSIKIGNLPCSVLYESSTLITCNAPPGDGIKSVTIYQNKIEFYGKDIYQYINPILGCPNDCSNNGKCLTGNGECECTSEFISFDCSVPSPTSPSNNKNLTIDNNTGGSNIQTQEIQFFIYFKSLFEIDFNGNIIKSYQLQNKWIVNETTTTTQNNYKFIQTLDNGCTIVSSIDEITNSNQYTFADTTFKLNNGDIKFSISIKNYIYQSNLNSLKLELITSVDQDKQQQQQQSNECNSKQTKIESINNDESSLFNYIKISKNNKILFARFLNKLLSDGKSTFFSISTLIQNNDDNVINPLPSDSSSPTVVLSFNLPHCVNECLIDPDFSVLLDTDFKSICNNDSDNRKWIIPVAIVVPIISLSIIIFSAVIIYKKYSIAIKIKAYKLKRRE